MLLERAAVDEFQAEKGLPSRLVDGIDLNDIGMLKFGDGFGFQTETGQIAGVGVIPRQNHLDGDEPIEAELPRLINDAHAAAA